LQNVIINIGRKLFIGNMTFIGLLKFTPKPINKKPR